MERFQTGFDKNGRTGVGGTDTQRAAVSVADVINLDPCHIFQ